MFLLGLDTSIDLNFFSLSARYLYPEPLDVSYHGASSLTPLSAVTTLALIHCKYPLVWRYALLLLITFLNFLILSSFHRPSLILTPPFPLPLFLSFGTYNFHCSKQLTNSLTPCIRLVHGLRFGILVESQDAHLDRILIP